MVRNLTTHRSLMEIHRTRGLENQRYAWGNQLTLGNRHRYNIWQGDFPDTNTGVDSDLNTAPVDTFDPNGFGLYNVCGNVWEWCKDWFSPKNHVLVQQPPSHHIAQTHIPDTARLPLNAMRIFSIPRLQLQSSPCASTQLKHT